ncbi:MAG: DegV family protein [Actinobacteria bacterium]|nr:DegV family protein [Actinomycetota bacterium]
MSTAIVTDSTASIGGENAVEKAISVVPLTVIVRGEPHDEGAPGLLALMAEAMRAGETVTTSHPGPGAFLERYQQLAQAGADEIVSIHLSSQLSGACNSARLAALDSPVRVRVVDSRSVAMGLGFPVLAAAEVAAAGGSADEVAARAEEIAGGVAVWFFVDDLDVLRRGGRIGAARALWGNALAIKPVLTITGGEVAPFEKVRTTARAVARLEDLAVERSVFEATQIAVHHVDALDRADDLAARLRDRLPSTSVEVSELPAVIAAHSGPGTLAVVVAPVPSLVGHR